MPRRFLHMYIEKEYMKVMRETVSGGGSRYFAGSRYFMTPSPKLVHAIQHQIFKEKKKKFARPHQFPTMVARGISNFFWSRLILSALSQPQFYCYYTITHSLAHLIRRRRQCAPNFLNSVHRLALELFLSTIHFSSEEVRRPKRVS